MKMIMKPKISGSIIYYIRIDIAVAIFFVLVYSILVLRTTKPDDSGSDDVADSVDCFSFDGCHKEKGGEERKGMAVDDDREMLMWTAKKMKSKEKQMLLPSFLEDIRRGTGNIALVNTEADRWPGGMDTVEEVEFDRVPGNITWEQFFPVWIDEEEEYRAPSCPEMPMPDLGKYGEAEVVVVELPQPKAAKTVDGRDVFRLQVHLVAAYMAVMRGRRDGQGKVKVVFHSEGRPMMEIFRCDDLVVREGRWWMYRSETARLEEKLKLPVGTCQLALPWNKTGDMLSLPAYDPPRRQRKREAYATVLHSDDKYICGAITLAQSLLRTGTDRDLVLLYDDSISAEKLRALDATGWKLRLISRIRSPHASKKAYNAYNYSKLRLWQLVEYSKVVFIDADVIVLRNLDALFRMPELSASANSRVIFNSGVMVIEPSECTFHRLMTRRNEIVPYNGGDQGFLNEIFVWWHRLPRRVNFMKSFQSNTRKEVERKDRLFRSDPPVLYAVHYLGNKPWTCYRDYDCNWNIKSQRQFASDAAHSRWWMVHDSMPKNLRRFCRLPSTRKVTLERHRKSAMALQFPDGHWKRAIIADRRPFLV